LTNFEMFGNGVKHGISCLIYLNISKATGARRKQRNKIVIVIFFV